MKSTFTEHPKEPKWVTPAEADEVAKWNEEAKHAKNCAKEQIIPSKLDVMPVYLQNSSMQLFLNNHQIRYYSYKPTRWNE